MQSTKNIPMRNIFSERLRTLRAQKDMTSLAMADFLEFSQPVYSRYENGRVPDVDTVAAIAERCGVTVDWLLGRGDTSPPASATVQPAVTPTASACRYPADCALPGQIAELREDYAAMHATLTKMAGQIEAVTGLLGNALANGLRNPQDNRPEKQQRKAG